jgi:integrase
MKPEGHPDTALSALAVRSLKQPGRYADGNGLYLVVDETGAKRWILRTVVHGRRRDIGLGIAKLVALADAREDARTWRRLARSGGDPVAERAKLRRKVPTFEGAARSVHKEQSPGWRNAKHASQWINTLQEYAFPTIGNRRVDQIESHDVLRILTPIWLSKYETARRLKQRIKTVFDWAKASGFRSGDNPVDGVQRGLPKRQERATHHAALPYAEVSKFVRDLRESTLNEQTRLAFELLILTAARTSEVLCAEWTEFDLGQKGWTVPASRMKASREHRVPLAPRVMEVLRRARELSSASKFVFPSRDPELPLSNMVFLMALRRMEVAVTVHGFRSAFRDWSAERTNFAREVCEMALAHSIKDRTEAAYRRGDLFDKRRQLMNAWSNYATSKPAQIVQLRSQATP